MHSDDYVGWLALALTPGLGARTAGKLLREFGSPDAIFNASLTALEGQRLPAAVAQALHSRQPLSDAVSGYRVVRLLEAAQQSIEKNGREVTLLGPEIGRPAAKVVSMRA